MSEEAELENDSGYASLQQQTADVEPAKKEDRAVDLGEQNDAGQYSYTLDGGEIHNHSNGLVGGTMAGFVFQMPHVNAAFAEKPKFEDHWRANVGSVVADSVGNNNIGNLKDSNSHGNFSGDSMTALTSDEISQQLAAAVSLQPQVPRVVKTRSRRKPRRAPIKCERKSVQSSGFVDIKPKLEASDQNDSQFPLHDVPEMINKGILITDKKPGNSLVSLTNSKNQKGSRAGRSNLGLMDMKSAFEEIGNMAKCLICNKILANKNNRTFHWRSHVGDKRYTCDICNKAFTHPSNMRSHRKIHTDEKPFPCELCDRRFRRRDYLLQHLERFHYNPKSGSSDSASDMKMDGLTDMSNDNLTDMSGLTDASMTEAAMEGYSSKENITGGMGNGAFVSGSV